MHNIEIRILHPRAAPPTQGTPDSAGYDLVACTENPIKIKQGGPAVLIPTGVAIWIRDPGIAGLILPRSGLGHRKGLVLGNTVGLIDADYQNQWYVSAWNRGGQFGCEEIVINPFDKIAQVVFVPVLHPQFTVVPEFSNETERGLGGFGSTDKPPSTHGNAK